MSEPDVMATWSEAPFSHPPLANATGPFPLRPFLETWWRHNGEDDRLALVATDAGALPLRQSDGRVLFCGDPDLTDYHNPLGEPAEALAVVAARFPGTGYSFDSLPDAAAVALHAALDGGGHAHAVTSDAVTVVLELPETAAGWHAQLKKRDRHEMRRKRRRFEEALGEAQLERRSDEDAVGLFADMHRTAAGAKGGFMSKQREDFFSDLVASADASVDVLSTDHGPAAAAFAFARPDGYYLYNSAYSPEAAAFSPGIVLLAMLVESLIADGVPRLDLLKGDEPYKLRLGAVPRPLYRIEGTFV